MKTYDKTGVDLAGKVVRLYQAWFKRGLRADDHLFRCEGGFGCSPSAMGKKVFGTFLSDGEEVCICRGDIECVVVLDEEDAK